MGSLAQQPAGMRIGDDRRSVFWQPVPVIALGLALSAFLAISYLLCIAGYLLRPDLPIQHALLGIFLPGFSLLSWTTFFLGLVESALWGWYIAVVFGPLFNFFVRKFPFGALQ
jgi:hypothetical protein